jgi:hypothetical protein
MEVKDYLTSVEERVVMIRFSGYRSSERPAGASLSLSLYSITRREIERESCKEGNEMGKNRKRAVFRRPV